ncbi:MAG: outer membrane [Geobacteraceae bacterium]|nr:MAG: outer membrane [Geobacteraceae bacterium]
MKRLLLMPFLALLLLSGCAHVISEEARRLVDPTVNFDRLRDNPDAYIGKYAMLGGMIAGAKNTKEGGQLEVVQLDLESDGIPEDTFRSGGRFLATTPNFLDIMIYKPGRLVTIVGEVKGKKTLPLDEIDYTYPVISIREIHALKTYDTDQGYPYPTPGPYLYDPYYYGYWPGPYWYRPLGPAFKRW